MFHVFCRSEFLNKLFMLTKHLKTRWDAGKPSSSFAIAQTPFPPTRALKRPKLHARLMRSQSNFMQTPRSAPHSFLAAFLTERRRSGDTEKENRERNRDVLFVGASAPSFRLYVCVCADANERKRTRSQKRLISGVLQTGLKQRGVVTCTRPSCIITRGYWYLQGRRRGGSAEVIAKLTVPSWVVQRSVCWLGCQITFSIKMITSKMLFNDFLCDVVFEVLGKIEEKANNT